MAVENSSAATTSQGTECREDGGVVGCFFSSIRESRSARASEYDHPARVLARFEVGERLRRLVDLVAARDELVEFESSRHVELQHPRKIDARHAGAEVAALDGLFLEHHAH